jgi:CTP synthase
LLVLASCPIDSKNKGQPRLHGRLKINLVADSLAYRIYQKQEIAEAFNCNYELNNIYREEIERAGMKVSGISGDGGARIVELPRHRFFIATGFLPQLTSDSNTPHPLVLAFLEAALRSDKKDSN